MEVWKKVWSSNISSLQENFFFTAPTFHYVWRFGRKIRTPRERKICEEREREGKIQKRNNEFNKMKNFICMRKEEEKTNETKKEKETTKKTKETLGRNFQEKKSLLIRTNWLLGG